MLIVKCKDDMVFRYLENLERWDLLDGILLVTTKDKTQVFFPLNNVICFSSEEASNE